MFLILILDKSEQCQYTDKIYSNLLHWLYYYKLNCMFTLFHTYPPWCLILDP